ncbi:MAG: tripartite tricarboxylate transporter substrate binding protein, partial [Betaproteobacteria bacterium]|nr:tripartite tricarboxylate transporter substrate binding protein [Betaproteobacteria bacterium]
MASFALLALALFTLQAGAQQWKPARNVEIVAPSGAGGGSDGIARLVQKLIQDHRLVEVPVAVVNRPGAGGAIAWGSLNQHQGDGHFVAISTANLLTNYITGKSALNYTDLTPIAQLFSESVAAAVRADSPIRDGKELLERLKSDASALSIAMGTTLANPNHIALALATRAAGGDARKLKAVVFPAAAQGMAALLGGHVEVVASPAYNLIPHMQAGRIRILAVSAPRRLAGALAGVPTWREQGAEVVVDNMRGVVGPKALGAAQVSYWEAVLSRMI